MSSDDSWNIVENALCHDIIFIEENNSLNVKYNKYIMHYNREVIIKALNKEFKNYYFTNKVTFVDYLLGDLSNDFSNKFELEIKKDGLFKCFRTYPFHFDIQLIQHKINLNDEIKNFNKNESFDSLNKLNDPLKDDWVDYDQTIKLDPLNKLIITAKKWITDLDKNGLLKNESIKDVSLDEYNQYKEWIEDYNTYESSYDGSIKTDSCDYNSYNESVKTDSCDYKLVNNDVFNSDVFNSDVFNSDVFNSDFSELKKLHDKNKNNMKKNKAIIDNMIKDDWAESYWKRYYDEPNVENLPETLSSKLYHKKYDSPSLLTISNFNKCLLEIPKYLTYKLIKDNPFYYKKLSFKKYIDDDLFNVIIFDYISKLDDLCFRFVDFTHIKMFKSMFNINRELNYNQTIYIITNKHIDNLKEIMFLNNLDSLNEPLLKERRVFIKYAVKMNYNLCYSCMKDVYVLYRKCNLCNARICFQCEPNSIKCNLCEKGTTLTLGEKYLGCHIVLN